MLRPGLPPVLLTILSLWFAGTARGTEQTYASHYADGLHGNGLCGGEAFDTEATTAAHRQTAHGCFEARSTLEPSHQGFCLVKRSW